MDVQQSSNGKWLLVSGGSRGIGRALVSVLAREGDVGTRAEAAPS